MRLQRFFAVPLLALLWIATIGSLVAMLAARGSDYAWFDPVIDVRAMLLRDHVDTPDQARMQQAILTALADSVGDPHTVWVAPEQEAAFTKAITGSYVGIGAEMDPSEPRLTIVTPLEDSPALEAGILPGDIVLTIDDFSTLDRSASECLPRILGPEGSSVRLEVRHLDGTEQTLEIVRRAIVSRTVKGVSRSGTGWNFWLDREGGIAYLRISQFTDQTAEDFHRALEIIAQRPAPETASPLRALVLDLRFNGGGTLTGAIAVADEFLGDAGIVSVKPRRGHEAIYRATPPSFDAPLVVLVNEFSASASEIVAGALQENQRAKVLGTRTHGKGSVQEVRELPGEAGILKITVARYALPSGRFLDRQAGSDAEHRRWGVDPDAGFHVPMNSAQYQAMYNNRRRFEVLAPSGGAEAAIVDFSGGSAGSWGDPAWLRTTLCDDQLAAALEALRGKLATGEWPRVGGDGGDEVAASEELAAAMETRDRMREQLEVVDRRIAELQTP